MHQNRCCLRHFWVCSPRAPPSFREASVAEKSFCPPLSPHAHAPEHSRACNQSSYSRKDFSLISLCAHQSALHCGDELSDTHILEERYFWLTVVEASVHGMRAPRQGHCGGKAWRSKVAQFITAQKQRRGQCQSRRAEGAGTSPRPGSHNPQFPRYR